MSRPAVVPFITNAITAVSSSKSANGGTRKQAQYINVLRVHIVRSCGDVDLLIPASGSELELDFIYEDSALFEFRSWRGVERIGVADHHTLEVLGEYIFPTRPGVKHRP